MLELLSLFRRKPNISALRPAAAARTVVLEWRGDDGQPIRQEAQIRAEGRYLVARVSQQPPEGRLAQVREEASSYPVEIVSAVPADDEYEIRLDYLWEGRRRRPRVSAVGAARLETNGAAPLQAEVVNVSPDGMKLFAAQPAEEGSPARVIGSTDSYLGFVRYCSPAPQGYHIGVQFYGERSKEGNEGDE